MVTASSTTLPALIFVTGCTEVSPGVYPASVSRAFRPDETGCPEPRRVGIAVSIACVERHGMYAGLAVSLIHRLIPALQSESLDTR